MSERMSDVKTYLSIEDIEKNQDTRYAEAEAWGGTVRLGSLCAEDMIEFVETNEGPAKRTAGIRLIVKSLVDAEGNRIGESKHIAMLKTKDAATITRLVGVVLELNMLNVANPAATKNESSEAPTGASPTVLH